MATKRLKNLFYRSTSTGQSLVEFELALVVLIFLLLGVTDFGLAFFSWISLRDAAEEGATFASVSPPYNYDSVVAIRERVKNASMTPIDLETLSDEDIDVQLVGSIQKPCPGYSVRIDVKYNYHMISPMISQFVGSMTIPVSASVTNTILQAANGYVCN